MKKSDIPRIFDDRYRLLIKSDSGYPFNQNQITNVRYSMTEKETGGSILETARQAKSIARKLANLDAESKNQLLLSIRNKIQDNRDRIASANALDVQAAEQMVAEGTLTPPLLSRLILSDDKINQLGTYLEEVASLEDPVGQKQFAMKLADDMELTRVSCPIGVVSIIFESRPEVVIQVTALSLKSGNVAILKGGTEASHSNRILFDLIDDILKSYQLKGAVNLIETREDVANLLNLDEYVDLIIPRGSNEFVRYIQNNTKIPVLGHSSGICHLYLDEHFDPQKAIPITLDAKLDYPSACNAVETLLIHEKMAEAHLPTILKELKKAAVHLVGCDRSRKIADQHHIHMEAATEEDWITEYTDLVLSIKMVSSLSEAVEHINTCGSHHTDSIITEDDAAADYFLKQVDSSCVFHNVSTRFSDGYVFGLGAEVGISTNKTHSRGPVGLEGMVIYKYLLTGNGQIRSAFSGKDAQPFLHIPLPLD